ncbi:MAG: acireductone synthase, partial [Gammaproteobacteria bacterium]
VKDVLFPYARKHLPAYVRRRAGDPEVRNLLNDVCAEAGKTLDEAGIIQQLEVWMDEDRKVTPLKTLQGMVWEEGYRSGDFTGHVYPDVAVKLREWRDRKIRLYVFSSGSIAAQKLLFGHSDYGDLTPLFSGYFDTHMGSKREAASYRAILGVIGMPGSDALFLSDTAAELDAAREAGMHTLQLLRPGTEPAPGHAQVRSFDEIDLPDDSNHRSAQR